MKIHNLMEDIVLEKVAEIFDEETSRMQEKGYCVSSQCRLDVACFVLNRIAPRYTTSSRGLTHLRKEYQKDLQKMADLVRNINDAIKQVSAIRRPHYDHSQKDETPAPEGPLFNFPTIMGRLLNGKTFEPMSGIDILLKEGDDTVRMIESGWINPYRIVENTDGSYLFWPYPAKAEKVGERSSFEFLLQVPEDETFDELNHYFTLTVEAEDYFIDSVHLQRTHEVPDLYLFPK